MFVSICRHAWAAFALLLVMSSGAHAQAVSQVADIYPAFVGSDPGPMVVMNGVGYFAATDPVAGRELWRTDGTSAGTWRVADCFLGALSGDPQNLVVAGNRVFFTANAGLGRELWFSDGTGAWQLKDIWPGSVGGAGAYLTAVGSRLFFRACDPTNGCELWTSDGTPAGTRLVRDIWPGGTSSSPAYLVAYGDGVLFSANDGVLGEELWRSDGTATGTVLVKDIDTLPIVTYDTFGRSFPTSLKATSTGVVFMAKTYASGYELWKTDGTTAGTVMVRELVSGSGGGVSASDPATFFTIGDLVFFYGRDASTGPGSTYRAFVSDGTAVGTREVGLPSGALPRALLNGWYYFGGYDGLEGLELWRSDLTAAGTALFVSIVPGSASSSVSELRTERNHLYFTAFEPATGTEVWRTDGTVAGTAQLSDVNPGSASAFPTLLARVGDRLLFAAVSVSSGRELWSVVVNRAPVANAGPDVRVEPGQLAALDGAASSDPDADPLTYEWRDASGTLLGTGVTPAVTLELGIHDVTLIVSDGVTTASDVVRVRVGNRAPTASAGGPYTGFSNTAIAFDGTASSDPDSDSLSYAWDFGDGQTGTSATPSHSYATPGSYTVTLIVNDGEDDSPASTATVTIPNRAPAAAPGGPYSGTRTAAVVFSGTASSDPDGDALTYAWDFGDGTTGTGAAPSHAYATLGSFVVSLVVHDGTVASAPLTTTVQISNLAPAVAITTPAVGAVFTAPASVSIAATASDPEAAIASVAFYAGAVKIGESFGPPFAMTWLSAPLGPHVLTAVVTDDGGAAAASAPVSIVVNAPPAVSITAPVGGTQAAAPATFAVTASASDADGAIVSVEFFRNGTSLGVATSSPFAVTWSNAPVGAYLLTAVARDSLGATTTSTPVPVAVTASLAPQADAHVRASQGNANFGSATALLVQQGSSNSTRYWTYLTFDLSSVPSVTNAKVRVFGGVTSTTTAAVQIAAYAVANTAWTETGLTWNNKPPSGTTALASVTVVNNSTTARWYELDVTTYLQAEKAAGRNVVSLALKNAANTPSVSFQSDESSQTGNRPRLVVVP